MSTEGGSHYTGAAARAPLQATALQGVRDPLSTGAGALVTPPPQTTATGPLSTEGAASKTELVVKRPRLMAPDGAPGDAALDELLEEVDI